MPPGAFPTKHRPNIELRVRGMQIVDTENRKAGPSCLPRLLSQHGSFKTFYGREFPDFRGDEYQFHLRRRMVRKLLNIAPGKDVVHR
jgi:hypothetical protein